MSADTVLYVTVGMPFVLLAAVLLGVKYLSDILQELKKKNPTEK